MKRFAAVILTVAAAVCVLSVSAIAGKMGWMYAGNWKGAKASRAQDELHLVMREPGTAYYDFSVADDYKCFFVYIEAGNYEGRGKSMVTLDCLDREGNTVSTFGSAEIPDDGSYHRIQLGEAESGMYAAIPEGTAVMRLSMTFEEGKNSPYFDVGADFSGMKATDLSIKEWTVSEKYKLVDAETTEYAHWVLVGFVFAVAGIMMIFAKVRKKYRKGK